MMNEEMIHVLCGLRWNSERFNYAIQNVVKSNFNYLFMEFPFNSFSPWFTIVTENTEGKTADKGELLVFI